MPKEEIIDTLRQAGYRITTPRRVVVDALVEASGHLTAQELIEEVERRDLGIGRVSVYRTLDLLNDLGLVQASSLGGTVTTYVLTTDGCHHHLVCLSCSRTIEFDGGAVDKVIGEIAEWLGCELQGHLLELYGYCPECRARRQKGDG
jgi:Fur family ferric uptake transcriptional regulator